MRCKRSNGMGVVHVGIEGVEDEERIYWAWEKRTRKTGIGVL